MWKRLTGWIRRAALTPTGMPSMIDGRCDRRTLQRIEAKLEAANVKLSDIAGEVKAVSDQLAKAQAEIVAKITDLETALANVELPPEAVEAIAALKTSAQGLDDIVPG